MQNARLYLEHLLAQGELEAAIEGGLILCRFYKHNELKSTLAQYSGRFHTLMDEYHAGTINDDDYRPERARITQAMLEFLEQIPSDWTDEALLAARFNPAKFEYPRTTAKPKRTVVSWPILMLLGLGGLLVAGFIFREKFFPEKATAQQELKQDVPDSRPAVPDTIVKSSPAPKVEPGPSQVPPKSPTQTKAAKTTPEARQQPSTSSNTLATPDNKFRSFAKSRIIEDMERGYIGQKLAFRNVRTKEILCCYTEAADFSGGKAYVSQDGKYFFYINKQGNRVE